ncbi:hypothetical protein B0I31_104454 [Saccharothrix carnea]|uniref:Uncharacterized protein n=1 Tax=Saccharothrix carnea TaxID=1280637 RepID=A0A2P8ICH5_SACCR|nr:hypothetical protein [Saccharothrix carnea]PSL56163.1 hypothetical protein B0I31_104454 [Saccharothrix carnea]
MSLERVEAEREAGFARVAAAVEADLRFVGLPVFAGGDVTRGVPSPAAHVVVFYDPLVDGAPGVFVTWNPGREALQASLMLPGTPDRAVDLAAAALESMLGALADVLAAAGWRVDREDVGVHETAVKVGEA